VKFFKSALPVAFALLLSGALTQTASAQNATTVDIQRLQDSLDDASRDVADLRGRDSALASRLQSELDDLRDETIYLKVKIKKNEPVARTEYFAMRDKIDTVRSRARGAADRPGSSTSTSSSSSSSSSTSTSSGRATSGTRMDVPVGTELDVRLTQSLSSATAKVEDRFEATTLVDLREGDRVIIPAGSVMRGVVSSVTKTTRLERKGALTLAFDQVTINGRAHPIRATVTQAIESEGVRGEAGKIGAGAGVGAIIGGILGGVKGALAGILIGGGGTIAATEGKDVELPAGTVLRVRLDSGLNLR
jgi:hypothetical protein